MIFYNNLGGLNSIQITGITVVFEINADAVQDICVESDATEKYAALSGNSIQMSYWFIIIHQLTCDICANVHHCGFLRHQGQMSRYASACFFRNCDMWLGSLYSEEKQGWKHLQPPKSWPAKSLMPN